MVARILFVLAGAAGVVGLAWVLLSAFAARSVENGVSRHIVAGSGIMRGVKFLAVGVILLLIALAAR